MRLSLSAADLAHCEAVTRTLLSPLAASSIDAWRAEVNEAMRTLFGADRAIFLVTGLNDPFFSTDAPDVVGVLNALVAGQEADGLRFHDPVVNAWNTMRRRQHMHAFSWDLNAQMIAANGLAMTDSPMVQDALLAQGVRDFDGVYSSPPAGEAMLWMLYDRPGACPFGEQALPLYHTLLPTFDAGLTIMTRFFAYRDVLDCVQEPTALVACDGRVLHQNAALVQLTAADPEHLRLHAALQHLVHQLAPLGSGRPLRQPAAPAQHTVRTAQATYTVRAALLPAGCFIPDPCVFLSVTVEAPPALPDADTVRARFGLTRREAEVALLLAAGLPNAALADRLFISPHTARRHTENVLAKLELTSRNALALRLMHPAAAPHVHA